MTRCLVVLIAVAVLFGGGSSTLTADDAVDSGREALGNSSRHPWYDDSSDSLRPLSISPSQPAQSHSPATSQSASSRGGTVDWSEVVVWTVLAIVLGLVIYALMRAYLNRELRTAAAATVVQGVGSTDSMRIEALPFRVERRESDLLSEARRLAEAGRYGEAIQYLFSYQLVELDRAQLVHLTRGKTNRQYLREIGRRAPLRSLVEQTMVAFEEFFFGNHPLDRGRFEACWSRLDEFQAGMKAENAQRTVGGFA